MKISGDAFAAAADFIDNALLNPNATHYEVLSEWYEGETLAREEDRDEPPPPVTEIAQALLEAVRFLRGQGAIR